MYNLQQQNLSHAPYQQSKLPHQHHQQLPYLQAQQQEPNRDSQKVIVDCVKLMINIWGFNNGNGTPTVFDQRKQTIRIEDSSETN